MVHKWTLVFLTFITGCFVVTKESSGKNISVERSNISVGINAIGNSCSSVKISYFVDEVDEIIYVPYGITGIESNELSLAVLYLDSIDTNTRKLPLHLSQESNEKLLLKSKSSPYEATFDLKNVFGDLKGEYYLKYSYVTGPIERTTKSGDIVWIFDSIVSERYYVIFNGDGCICKFVGDGF